MILKWIKVKKMELEFKVKLYTYATSLLEEQEDVIKFFENIYVSLKDTPINELQDKLISAIADNSHRQAMLEREKEAATKAGI